MAHQPPPEPLRLRSSIRGRLRRLHHEERGTAVVEFALVAIPLCLIVFGILDFGRALNYYNDLTQLGGQGARAASVNQNPNGGAANASFQQQLACSATSGELKNGINVAVTTTPVNVGDPVTITASYTFHFIPFLKLGNLTLTAAQTQRYESPSAPGFSAANNVSGGAGTCP
jgi:Flp pilus assembly protein TadG